jgi:hypothetical protein
VLAAASVIGALAWTQPNVDGADLWWHLAAGRHYAESGQLVARVDPFSHTARGRPWINHEWLWDRAAWTVYRVHEDLLAWVELALIGATFAMVAVRARRASGSWFAACASTWLAAATSHWYFDLRPQLVTFASVALLLATLEWRRAHWLWPPLFALWTNLHAGFLFGLGLIGLHALDQTEHALADRTARPAIQRIWAGVALAALAVCLNPWGPSIYAIPFQPLGSGTPFGGLVEWHHTPLSLDPTSYAGRFVWMFTAAALGALVRPRDPFAIALAGITAAIAVAACRFIPLFAIVAAPIAARGFAAGASFVARPLPLRARGAAGAALVLLGAAASWRDVRLSPHLFQRWTFEQWFPSGAAAYLSAMPAPPRHLFALYEWGGYLMLHAPSVPVFIDGRAGTVYADEVARDYLVLADVRSGWQKQLAAHQIDAVLLPPGAPLAQALTHLEPPWAVAHADPRSALLLPPGAPLAAELGLSGADLPLSRGAAALAHGRIDEAKAAFELAQQIDPQQFAAYVELMLVAAQRRETPQVRRWIAAALAQDPRWRERIWLAAVEAFASIGDLSARRDALRQVRLRGPFDDVALREWVESAVRHAEAPLHERVRSR